MEGLQAVGVLEVEVPGDKREDDHELEVDRVGGGEAPPPGQPPITTTFPLSLSMIYSLIQ